MALSKAELILHPIRGRILMTLSRRRLTTRQIAQMLPDISQASVYRHIAILAEYGILQVVEEVPVRGLIERVYALDEEAAALVKHDELGDITPNDYLRYFQTFVEDLMQSYRLYTAQADADPKRDGVTFWGEILYLTRQERDEVVAELREVTQRRADNLPHPDRLRYYIARAFIPERGIGGDSTPPKNDPAAE